MLLMWVPFLFSFFFSFIISPTKIEDINQIDTDNQDWQSHLSGQGGGGCLYYIMKADPGVDELIVSDKGKAHAPPGENRWRVL